MVFKLRTYQEDAVRDAIAFFGDISAGRQDKFLYRSGTLVLPTGCHEAGYAIRMHDKTWVAVEQITTGDKVMGKDGGPREVLALCRGRQAMYRIKSLNGEVSFRVNGDHVLHLWNEYHDDFFNIPAKIFSTFQPKNHYLVVKLRGRFEYLPFSIEEEADDEFYGFTLDGDHLYVGADGVVHHNSGKSIVIGEIAKRLGVNVLCLQPSKELLVQNFKKYQGYGLKNAAIYSASLNSKRIHEVTFATPQSILSAIKKIKKAGGDPKRYFNFSLILADEIHLGSQKGGTVDIICSELLSNGLKGADAFTVKCLIGLTATPFRLSSGVGGATIKTFESDKKNIVANIFHTTQIQEMTRDKFWTPIVYKQPQTDVGKLKLNSAGTDYTEESLSQYWLDNDIHKKIGLLLPWLKERDYKNTLIFAPTVRDGKTLELMYPNYVRCVYGDMPGGDRDKIIEDFIKGRIFGLVNVNVLGTGFDFPQLESAIHGRPTRSLALWYQHLGRLVRIYPGKEKALLIDLSGNTEVFGRIEELEMGRMTIYGKERYQISKGDLLLSNIPMDEIGSHKIGETINPLDTKHIIPIKSLMPWGKHTGVQMRELPEGYLRWLSTDYEVFNSFSMKIKVTAQYILKHSLHVKKQVSGNRQ